MRFHTFGRMGYAMVVQAINALTQMQIAWPLSLTQLSLMFARQLRSINYYVIQIPNTSKPPHVCAMVC